MRQEGIAEKEEEWARVEESKNSPYLAKGEENAITCALSAFSGKCGVWKCGGSRGVCALWQPALPYSMLIDACSAF